MTAKRLRRRSSVPLAMGAGFLGGVLTTAALMPRLEVATDRTDGMRKEATEATEATAGNVITISPTSDEVPAAVTRPMTGDAEATIAVDPVADRRRRGLQLPVKGMTRDDLLDTFADLRGGTRRHEAIDVLASRHTPVVAVEDGTVARLFLSEPGGITVYQFDPSKQYVYYYAHLEGYAPGLTEGDHLSKGQVIGYVGTTGNAPRDTPHLHFAIFKLAEPTRWWEGTPIDPYQVLK
jgi:murein DD-endopeptidase MepM/ murein hydrolase activator NlpD